MQSTLPDNRWISISQWIMTLLVCWCLPAFADSGDIPALSTALQGLVDILTGTDAKLLAVVAIAGVGYFWLSGKISLKHAVYICLGIGIIFSAPQIAQMLGA